jgi:hypothetical protein
MADLITLARAKYNIYRATTSAEDTTLTELIKTCSSAIEKYCRRQFDSQEFDELYPGNGSDTLTLRHFPIVKVTRVAFDPTTVLTVKNTSTSTHQRATARVTATGLELIRVSSGTVTTDTSITWAGNATLSAVASAVTALGNGWLGQVKGSYGSWRSADLRDFQGHLHALNVEAPLKIHTQELSDYEIDDKRGWLLRGNQPAFPGDDGGWCGGRNSWRVIYTAGWSTVPEDVQEACAEWVATLFWQTKRDPGSIMRRTADLTEQQGRIEAQIPAYVRLLLRPYRTNFLSLLEE